MSLIPQGEIPQPCLDELYAHYPRVDFSTYGHQITDKVRSRAFQHRHTEQTSETVKALDPETFEERTLSNPVWVTRYMVRGEFYEGVEAKVYAITTTGRCIDVRASS